MAANVECYHSNPYLYYSNREGMPAPLGQEEACNMATSPYVHGRQPMPRYPSLPSSTYWDPSAVHLDGCCMSTYPEHILVTAPLAENFPLYPSFLPPSPIYSGEELKPKVEVMEDSQSTSIHTMYTHPLPTSGSNQTQRCQWQNCPIDLDDLSHSGIRRHFRDYHSSPRGSTVRCQWGGNCRSEEMLYDNIAKHIAECHLKSMRTMCQSCGNSFARNDTLKRHLNAGCPAVGRQ